MAVGGYAATSEPPCLFRALFPLDGCEQFRAGQRIELVEDDVVPIGAHEVDEAFPVLLMQDEVLARVVF